MKKNDKTNNGSNITSRTEGCASNLSLLTSTLSLDNSSLLPSNLSLIYQVYPQSFYDTNGDGIGDIEGIIRKIEYLSELGVDAVWLSPIYCSPWADCGYDITDHKSIDPIYGDIESFRRLLDEAHRRNIKIIMDLVMNHTSDRHPLFAASRLSRQSPERDMYIWRDKPNNWLTNFGASGWSFDPTTKEYYYHSFFREQPDLNWRNPHVEQEMFDVARFWLDLGVDGFRLDVVNMIIKDSRFRRNPPFQLFRNRGLYSRNRDEVYPILERFRRLLDSYGNRISIGEVYTAPPGDVEIVSRYAGNGSDRLHLVFDFSLIFARFSARRYRSAVEKYYAALHRDVQPVIVFSNHDLGRSLDRVFRTSRQQEKAKIFATLLMTLRGTPVIYYGDEIGMRNVRIPRKNIRDKYGKMFYPFYRGRDGARTPMQWNANQYAGFSETEPWLPVDKNHTTINVETEQTDPDSVYQWYKTLIRLRKTVDALRLGEIRFLSSRNNVLIYARIFKSEQITVAINFSRRSRTVISPTVAATIVASSSDRQHILPASSTIAMKPFEIVILSGALGLPSQS